MGNKSSAIPEPTIVESLKSIYGLQDEEVKLLLSDEETLAFARDLVTDGTSSATSLAQTRKAVETLRLLLKESQGINFLKYVLKNDA